MLVLSRKTDEQIIVEFQGVVLTTFTLVEIGCNKVRIGIEADRSVTIRRAELPSRREFQPAIQEVSEAAVPQTV